MSGAAAPSAADHVVARLEEAGRTLMALPPSGYGTALRTSRLEIVRIAAENYGWSSRGLRPPVPSAAAITRMDEVYGWLAMIPDDRFVLRRIVGARSLVHPLTDRHVFPWRRLATVLGADHKAVQRWHGQGIGMILLGLARVRPAGA